MFAEEIEFSPKGQKNAYIVLEANDLTDPLPTTLYSYNESINCRSDRPMTLLRAKCVKHVEWEILNMLIGDDEDSHYTSTTEMALDGLVPRGDEVAVKRYNAALKNIKDILRGMREKRVKHLPKEHHAAGDE
tara:strand:+ start:41 stop:436 length:396 start_codon:yes stop_codon:yes gene_type:complete